MKLCPCCEWHTVPDNNPDDRVCGYCAANACEYTSDRLPMVGVLAVMMSACVTIWAVWGVISWVW